MRPLQVSLVSEPTTTKLWASKRVEEEEGLSQFISMGTLLKASQSGRFHLLLLAAYSGKHLSFV